MLEENPQMFVPCGANTLNLMMTDFHKESINKKTLCKVVQKLCSLSSVVTEHREIQVERIKNKNTYTLLFSGVRRGEYSVCQTDTLLPSKQFLPMRSSIL